MNKKLELRKFKCPCCGEMKTRSTMMRSCCNGMTYRVCTGCKNYAIKWKLSCMQEVMEHKERYESK